MFPDLFLPLLLVLVAGNIKMKVFNFLSQSCCFSQSASVVSERVYLGDFISNLWDLIAPC